jgi:replicative DNA helicase
LPTLAIDDFQNYRPKATWEAIRTGIAKLDEKLGGWQPGIVSLVAARPAMGKSSLGLATADVATAAGHGVHLFSLEDTESAYADRSIARTSGVSPRRFARASCRTARWRTSTTRCASLAGARAGSSMAARV